MTNTDYNLLNINYTEKNIKEYIEKYPYIKEQTNITVFNDIALDLEMALENAFLNQKEKIIIEMLMNGKTKEDIIDTLAIAERTYYKYRKSAIKKILTYLQ